MSLSGRTISALKRAGVTDPHKRTLDYLIRLPNIGVKAITEIAERWYQGMTHLDNWPELEDRLKVPEPRCSHRVKISEYCARCAADTEIRTARRAPPSKDD